MAIDLNKRQNIAALWNVYLDDGFEFHIERDEFIRSVEIAAHWMGNPAWLKFGNHMVGPYFHDGTTNLMPFAALLELGMYLTQLSGQKNFSAFATSLRNVSQIRSVAFEAQTAAIFLNKEGVSHIEFANEYEIRGRKKRPDFDFIENGVRYSVECKRVGDNLSSVRERMDKIHNAFDRAVGTLGWPAELRIELDIIKPPVGDLDKYACSVIQEAKNVASNNINFIQFRGAKIHIAPLGSEFLVAKTETTTDAIRLTKPIPVRTDILMVSK